MVLKTHCHELCSLQQPHKKKPLARRVLIKLRVGTSNCANHIYHSVHKLSPLVWRHQHILITRKTEGRHLWANDDMTSLWSSACCHSNTQLSISCTSRKRTRSPAPAPYRANVLDVGPISSRRWGSVSRNAWRADLILTRGIGVLWCNTSCESVLWCPAKHSATCRQGNKTHRGWGGNGSSRGDWVTVTWKISNDYLINDNTLYYVILGNLWD